MCLSFVVWNHQNMDIRLPADMPMFHSGQWPLCSSKDIPAPNSRQKSVRFQDWQAWWKVMKLTKAVVLQAMIQRAFWHLFLGTEPNYWKFIFVHQDQPQIGPVRLTKPPKPPPKPTPATSAQPEAVAVQAPIFGFWDAFFGIRMRQLIP